MDSSRFPEQIPALEPCPWCGHTPAPYSQQASNLLDTVLLLQAVVADLKRAIEEVAS